MSYIIRTKVNKDSMEQTTNLTIDWEGCDVETLKAIALSAIVIKVQAQWRKAKSGIPATATIKALDYKPGTRVAPEVKLETLVGEMTDEQKKALMEKLQRMIKSVEEAKESEESELEKSEENTEE